MQRQCPDCKGLFSSGCRTCEGTGRVHSSRPAKRGYCQRKPKRAKTPSYIKERREEERKFKQAMRGYLR